MSVVGFDVGNENCLVAVARQRGIDVVLNDESKRETPAMVSFTDSQRFLGSAAAATSTMNPKNAVSQIKRLIGRKYRDSDVQRDLVTFPYAVTEGPDGECLINVHYLGELKVFTPTQIMGMILANMKSIAEKNLGSHVVDCVIGIPAHFTELQRRAYLDAASIAGLHPLRLMHETTAIALAYGIYKTDLPEGDPIHVVFVDIGNANMQVCVAAFKKGQLKVLGTAFDRNLGGRDFDEALFNHFAAKFKTDHKIDVYPNARACYRLRTACQKVKKILSANAIAPLAIECLFEEKDVQDKITREEFEELVTPLLERIQAPLQKALIDAQVPLDKIHAVEVVGSGSRIPAIGRILASFFKKDPSRTLNASECISRGCALQCAMLSPTFKVREFEVQDAFPFPIALSWKGSTSEAGEECHSNNMLFVKGNPIPNTKMLTFLRSGTFTVDALYAETSDLPPDTSAKIGTFQIGPFTPKSSEKAKLKVKIQLNLHGIISVESAFMIEEEEVEVSTTKGSEESRDTKGPIPMETDMEEENTEQPADKKDETMGESGMAGSDPSANGKANIEAEQTKTEVGKKKKLRKTDVPVKETIIGGLSKAELQKEVDIEYELALQDRVMEETKERKNAVESYVYDMRNKLYEKLQGYVTESERDEFAAKLQHTEDWLYEEGENETKSVYNAKLAELKKLGDPIELRQKEEAARGPAINELAYCINSYREAAASTDPKFNHIDSTEKEKVLIECKKAHDWLMEKKQHQDALARSANPVLLSADIRKKAEVLDRFCKPIMTRPKPPPSKPQAAQTEETKAAEDKDGTETENAPAADPMDAEPTQPATQ